MSLLSLYAQEVAAQQLGSDSISLNPVAMLSLSMQPCVLAALWGSLGATRPTVSHQQGYCHLLEMVV